MSAIVGYRKGDRYQVKEGFPAHVLTMWNAPFTGGYERIIPPGLKFVVALDPPASASIVTADPEPPAAKPSTSGANKAKASADAGAFFIVPFDDNGGSADHRQRDCHTS